MKPEKPGSPKAARDEKTKREDNLGALLEIPLSFEISLVPALYLNMPDTKKRILTMTP
jgi:hypothetical protein